MREDERKIIRHAAEKQAKNILITGCKGLYQTKIAQKAAIKLMCLENGEDGCTCASCAKAKNHPDISLLPLPGKKTVTVEDVEAVLGDLALLPRYGRRRVLIVDGIDTCSAQVANSLLKVMEDDANVSVIGLDYSGAALDTIRSRSAEFFLRPYGKKEFALWAENEGLLDADFWYVASSGCPEVIARIKELDEGLTGEDTIEYTFRRVLEGARERNMPKILFALHMVKEKDPQSFFSLYRDLVPVLLMALRVQAVKEESRDPDRAKDIQKALKEEIPECRRQIYTEGDLLNVLILCYGLRVEIRGMRKRGE